MGFTVFSTHYATWIDFLLSGLDGDQKVSLLIFIYRLRTRRFSYLHRECMCLSFQIPDKKGKLLI